MAVGPLRIAFAVLMISTSLIAAVTFDPAHGQIRGMTAVGVMPAEGSGFGDPAGYEAVFVRRDDPGVILRVPAGQWALPPAGAYRIFLEGKNVVSGAPTNLQWQLAPFEGKGAALVKKTVPAGVVRLEGSCASNVCRGWLMHESSNIQSPVPYFSPEMLREPPLSEARDRGVLMPAGRVIAAIYDVKAKRFLGVTAPLQVARAQVSAARVAAPKQGRAALMLELTRPTVVLKQNDDDVAVALVTSDGKSMPAAFVARAHDKLFAVWPDVPAGDARVELTSSSVRIAQKEISLKSGSVEYTVRELALLPKLSVNTKVHERMRKEPATLTITDSTGGTPLITGEIENLDEPVVITVAAAPLIVSLTLGPWEVSEKVDLTPGIDQSVTVTMKAIRVSGRVSRGESPVPASVMFDTRADCEKCLTVKTNTEGEYELWLARPGVYFPHITLPDRSGPFIWEPVEIENETTLDFKLPDNRYSFRVTNKHTGEPVADARIVVGNKTPDEFVTYQHLKTNASGDAVAQPLRPGIFNTRVEASGFEPSDTADAPVTADGNTTIAVQLQPLGDLDTLTLLLPNGAPAAEAEILIDISRPQPVTIRTDEQGRAEIPADAANTVIAIYAKGAALSVRQWPGSDQRWTLEAPEPRPLVLRALRNGSEANSFARVVWLDGIRLAGLPLAWLFRDSLPAQGRWTVSNLPPRPVSVLLYRYREGSGFAAGLFDSMRKDIAWPWPAQVEVEVLE